MTITQLGIFQNNLHPSKERTYGILNDPNMKQYGLLMLQEQHWTSLTKSPIHHAWTLIEPTANDDVRPRSVIYVNNNILSASQIAPMTLPFNDITAIRLITEDAKIPSNHEHLQSE